MFRTLRRLALLALSLLLVSCAKAPAPVRTPPMPPTDSGTSEASCRAHIKAIMCVVDPPAKWEGPPSITRPCLPGGERYANAFEEIHDRMPRAFQKMFCSLKRISIENDFPGTAHSGLLFDKDDKPNGAQFGIKRALLDHDPSFNTWASWKEQLSFGASPKNIAVEKLYPRVELSVRAPFRGSALLYFLIAHEFAHLIDFSNGVNHFEDGGTATSGSWSSLTWSTKALPIPQDDFEHRADLCFYKCKGKPLDDKWRNDVYRSLAGSSFVSSYAATSPEDDFAESAAYYALMVSLNASVVITYGEAQSYDLIAKMRTAPFREKLQRIERTFSSTTLKYP